LLIAGGVHDFFVDEERMFEKGPGPLLDEALRQKVVDTIIPLADPAPGLPRVESYEIQGELERQDVPYREFVGEHKFLKARRKVRLKRYEIDPLLSARQRESEFNKVLRDMEALESLGDNTYIARAYEMSLDREDEQIFYLVSEWVGPSTLRDFISRVEGPLSPGDELYRQALVYALHLLRAVRFMHERSIIHRNLHPRVIYLTEGHQSVPLKIADFDYARVADLQSIAGEVSDIGTEGYTAPELWSEDDYDHCVDIFSIGAIIFEMFAGAPLFSSLDEMLDMEGVWETKRALLSEPDMREIVDGLIARSTEQRKGAFDQAIADFKARLDS
jgi:serine/threonine protein kinase